MKTIKLQRDKWNLACSPFSVRGDFHKIHVYGRQRAQENIYCILYQWHRISEEASALYSSVLVIQLELVISNQSK